MNLLRRRVCVFLSLEILMGEIPAIILYMYKVTVLPVWYERIGVLW